MFVSFLVCVLCVVIASSREEEEEDTIHLIEHQWGSRLDDAASPPLVQPTPQLLMGGLTSIGLLLRKKKKLFAFQIYLEFGKPTSNDTTASLSSFNHVHHLFLPPPPIAPPLDSCVIGSLHGRPVEPTKQTRKSIGKEKEKTHAERMFLLLLLLVMSPSNCLRV